MSGINEYQNLINWLQHNINHNYNKTYKLADVGCYDVGNGSVRAAIETGLWTFQPSVGQQHIYKVKSYSDKLAKCIEIVGFDFNVTHENDIKIDGKKIPEIYHNKFDFVTCIGTLNYGDNDLIMEEIKQLSKKDGKILINLNKQLDEAEAYLEKKLPKNKFITEMTKLSNANLFTGAIHSSSFSDGHQYSKYIQCTSDKFSEYIETKYPCFVIEDNIKDSGHEYDYFYLRKI